MSQQNTALIDDIMAALDAESSQNVELIVRNTQNGATKKMALASLEQIIYSYLTTAPVVTNLASVLGGVNMFECLSGNLSDINREGLWIVHYDIDHNPNATDFPSSYGDVISFQDTIGRNTYNEMYAFSNNNICYHRRGWAGTWSSWKEVSTNIPNFYKNYNDLNALATALKAIW